MLGITENQGLFEFFVFILIFFDYLFKASYPHECVFN